MTYLVGAEAREINAFGDPNNDNRKVPVRISSRLRSLEQQPQELLSVALEEGSIVRSLDGNCARR